MVKPNPQPKFVLVAALSLHMKRDATPRGAVTVASDCVRLLNHARELHRINERMCNGYSSSAEWGFSQEADEKRQTHLREKVIGIIWANYVDVKVTFGGDPRGCPFFLSGTYMPDYDIGGRGFGVKS